MEQNLAKIVIPAPGYEAPTYGVDGQGGSWEWLERVAKAGAVGSYIPVFCTEHNMYEFVPAVTLREDLRYWYSKGLHPRYSILEVVLSLPIRPTEAPVIRGEIEDLDLAEYPTAKSLYDALYPLCPVNLQVQGRRYRVTQEFKKKFREKSFTPEDFFEERSQELRRLILRATYGGIRPVLRELIMVAQDQEAALYAPGSLPPGYSDLSDMPVAERQEYLEKRTHLFNFLYLHVTCPSQGEDYLLRTPNHILSPMAARRWTFGLPEDAEFTEEA